MWNIRYGRHEVSEASLHRALNMIQSKLSAEAATHREAERSLDAQIEDIERLVRPVVKTSDG